MRIRFLVPAAVLLVFGVWSTTVALAHGYFGFIDVALAEPWGMQVLLDLTISCVLVLSLWLIPDARRRGIPAWPYVIATMALGSLGPLAYLVHRELKGEARHVPVVSSTDHAGASSPTRSFPVDAS